MSAKNQLQEFFQKKGLRLPEYTYTREGGGDHCPEWYCEVELPCKTTFKTSMCASKKNSSKQAAEMALSWLNVYKTTMLKEVKKKQIHLRMKDVAHIFVLLDLENVPHGYRDLCDRVCFDPSPEGGSESSSDDSNVTIVGFVGYAAPHIRSKILREQKEYGRPIFVIEACSSCNDAADLKMCMWVGELMGSFGSEYDCSVEKMDYSPLFELPTQDVYEHLITFGIATQPKIRLLVVTGDHFGKGLVELINGGNQNGERIEWCAELYHCVDDIVE